MTNEYVYHLVGADYFERLSKQFPDDVNKVVMMEAMKNQVMKALIKERAILLLVILTMSLKL